MPTPLYLLFDIDGTLIDAAGAGRMSLDLALQREFGKERSEKILLQGRTDLGIFSEYLERHGIEVTAENLTRFRQAYLELLPDQMRQRPGKVCPGVPQLLARLAADDRFRLGLLTGNSQASAYIKLAHFGIEQWFAFGIYGQNALQRIDLAKEVVECLNQVANSGWQQQQVVVIGDTPADIELGKAVGARTVGVATGSHPLDELHLAAPCVALNDLGDSYSWLERFLELGIQQ